MHCFDLRESGGQECLSEDLVAVSSPISAVFKGATRGIRSHLSPAFSVRFGQS